MKKVLRLKHTNDLNAPGGFCMSVGSIIEFYDGGFRNVEINDNYYPCFGPYIQLNTIAEKLANGEHGQYSNFFEVTDVTNAVTPKTSFDIGSIDGNEKLCTLEYKSVLTLLLGSKIKIDRREDRKFDYRMAAEMFEPELLSLKTE